MNVKRMAALDSVLRRVVELEARALAYRECGDMLDAYESSDPEHDTDVHRAERRRVMRTCYNNALSLQRQAENLKKGRAKP